MKSSVFLANGYRWVLACLLGLCLVFLAACSQEAVPPPLEPLVFSTPGSDFATDVSMFGSTVYVAGAVEGALDGNYLGFRDAIVRRYSYDGALMWGRQFGSSHSDQASHVATDGSGNAYVLGHTNGSLTRQRNLGSADIFLRKYDAFGNIVWTRQFGSLYSDIPFGIAIDNSHIYIAYRMANLYNFAIRKYTHDGAFVMSFANTDTDYPFPSAFSRDSLGNFYVLSRLNTGGIKLFKYNSSSTLVWSRRINTDSVAGSVVTDSSNAVYISWTAYTYPNVDDYQAIARVRKYDANGTSIWTRNVSPNSNLNQNTSLTRLRVDSANSVYIAGNTQGAYNGYSNQGLTDAFVLKYDSNGNQVWTRQFGTNGYDHAYGLFVSGRVFVVGYTGGNPNLLGQASPGNGDAYVRSLNMYTGSVVWTDQ